MHPGQRRGTFGPEGRPIQVVNHFLNYVVVDIPFSEGAPERQGVETKIVDVPWNPFAVYMDQVCSPGSKQGGLKTESRDLEPMENIPVGFLRGKRIEPSKNGNALAKLH